jgi:hypothetical protein
MRLKSVVSYFLAISIFSCACATLYAFESQLRDIRGKVKNELLEIRALMPKNDPILVSSIYDSCLIAMNQLDAYFNMLAIFNTIDEKAVKAEAVDALTVWLDYIKKMDTININALRDTTKALTPETKACMEKVKALFEELSKEIDSELAKVGIIKRSLPLR